MLKKYLVSIYQSDFSRRIGVYKHPALLQLKKILKKVRLRLKYVKEFAYIKEIMNNRKDISESFLKSHTYNFLYEISQVDVDVWKFLIKKIGDINFKRLKSKKTIEVMFLCNFSATWSCDDLFRLFLESDRFHPYIVVHHFYNGTEQTIRENMENAVHFFKKKGYEVYRDDDENGDFLPLEVLGNPDIIFHLSPYNMAFPKTLDVFSYTLDKININIPYGIYVAELSEFQYNLPSFSAYWKIFDLPFYARLAPQYTKLGNINRVGSGYCKLDALYKTSNVDPSDVWKIKNEGQKRIIYAPHHSIGEQGQRFSTFDKNYMILLDIAKVMSQETTWVLKPHPLLKKAAIEEGVFENEEEYEKYIEKWNELPNGKVITGGDYFDLFKTSDGMILDSDSFLAEYMFVDKPIMLLSRPEQKFSDLGQPLSKVIYQINGNDKVGIQEFIQSVIINGKDQLKSKRRQFFGEFLDYKAKNGILASEYIYQYILNYIEES